MIPKNIKGICELFDCTVMTDLSPKGFGNGVNNLKPIYYLGTPCELSAGLTGTWITKSFFSEKALEKYCASKLGHDDINKRAKEIFPDWLTDYEEWFGNICDGCFDIRGINASEHKCHSYDLYGNKVSDYYTHKGEKIKGECSCNRCTKQGGS
jgi:hypothetical protein